MAVMNPYVDHPAGAACLHQIRPEHGDDLIGSLPPELLIQIVDYLDPDIVQSQRELPSTYIPNLGLEVRRTKFLSETAIDHALRQTLAFLCLDGTNVAADDAMTYFKWRHGLEGGRPVKKIVIPRSKSRN